MTPAPRWGPAPLPQGTQPSPRSLPAPVAKETGDARTALLCVVEVPVPGLAIFNVFIIFFNLQAASGTFPWGEAAQKFQFTHSHAVPHLSAGQAADEGTRLGRGEGALV